MSTFVRGDRVLVDGMDGIVYWFAGYGTMEEYEGDYLVCDDDECDHSMSEMCWTEGDTSIVTDYDHAIVVMVGDDRRHDIHTEDVSLLPDDEHVCSCGQRGCPHQ